MSVQKSLAQLRLESLADWATKIELPGMTQNTYLEILNYVIHEQRNDGAWSMPGKAAWDTVLTAVVLKSLADLQFKSDDYWNNRLDQSVGISLAVRFLENAVRNAGGSPERLGEDIWDACQVALALAEFGCGDVAASMVRTINQDWKKLYERASSSTTRWSSPGYLAAIVDVIGKYEAKLGTDSQFEEGFAYLKNLERELESGFGFFPSNSSRPDTDIWGTSLVVRTIATVRENREVLVDRNQLQRAVFWLVNQLETDIWRQESAEAPMYLSRALQALRSARIWVDRATRDKIDQRLKSGNAEISGFFGDSVGPEGYLKSYTAVLEYLASAKIVAPAGLVFDASEILRESAIARREPVARRDGLRIAWLSDLHVGADEEAKPPSINLIKRFAIKLMWQSGTPLTQHFQLRNASTILDRVVQLKPDHVLISGDLTNYAQDGQFKQIHDQLLQRQAKLSKSSLQGLDSKLWTILPGNHDVTTEKAGSDAVRPNLGLFFRWFGTTYGLRARQSHASAFPLNKTIPSRNGKFRLRLIGLDSNVNSPVWVIGPNAKGRIDRDQFEETTRLLSDGTECELTLVCLHHHPIVVPELISQTQDYFLALNEVDGRKLVQSCANAGVAAILHGHFHRYSNWAGRTNRFGTMFIVGSPAGTLVGPGADEEFLELRECEHETANGSGVGLALYRHVRDEDGSWREGFTGTFMPVRSN